MKKLLAILFVVGAFVAVGKAAQAQYQPRVHIWAEAFGHQHPYQPEANVRQAPHPQQGW